MPVDTRFEGRTPVVKYPGIASSAGLIILAIPHGERRNALNEMGYSLRETSFRRIGGRSK